MLYCALFSLQYVVRSTAWEQGVLREAVLFKRCKNLLKKKKIFRKSGGAVMRVKITLACTECKQRNYNTMKNKKNDPDRLEMNKYCRFCRKHTLHKETK